jgi:hypothetical protein
MRRGRVVRRLGRSGEDARLGFAARRDEALDGIMHYESVETHYYIHSYYALYSNSLHTVYLTLHVGPE